MSTTTKNTQATKTVSQGESRYGTPEPQIALRFPKGTSYRVVKAALHKLEQEGCVTAEWHPSENNRRAKFYSLTAAGRRRLARETRDWHETADLIAAFLAPRRPAP